MHYTIRTQTDDGALWLRSLEFQEAFSMANDMDDARKRASDMLESVINIYIRDGKALPKPLTRALRKNEFRIELAPRVFFGAELYKAMRKAKVNRAELARRMRVHLPQVDRLLDVRHNSSLPQIERAFEALRQPLHLRLAS